MKRILIICLTFFCISQLAYADQYDADRHQMKLILNNIIKGVNEKDIKVFIDYVHPNAAVTFYDGHVAIGKEAVEQYFNRMLTAESPVLEKITIDGSEDKPATILNGNVGFAWGWISNQLHLSTGTVLDLNGRWSTSMIKEHDKWRITTIHFSTNIFDNALLNQAKDKLIWVGMFALLFGLIGGWFLTSMLSKRKS